LVPLILSACDAWCGCVGVWVCGCAGICMCAHIYIRKKSKKNRNWEFESMQVSQHVYASMYACMCPKKKKPGEPTSSWDMKAFCVKLEAFLSRERRLIEMSSGHPLTKAFFVRYPPPTAPGPNAFPPLISSRALCLPTHSFALSLSSLPLSPSLLLSLSL